MLHAIFYDFNFFSPIFLIVKWLQLLQDWFLVGFSQ